MMTINRNGGKFKKASQQNKDCTLVKGYFKEKGT